MTARLPRLVCLSLLVTALATPAGPAHAQVRPPCPNGTVCFWSERDFRDARTVILDPLPEVCMPLPVAASSAMNTTANATVRVYVGSDCDGQEIGAFGPGAMPVISPEAESYAIM